MRLLFAVFGCFLLLAGCKLDMPVLQPMGEVGMAEKHLLVVCVLLMLIVVVPTIILTLIFAFRYRAKNHHMKYTPHWAHSVAHEVVWWLVPIVIIAILAVITWFSTHKLDPYRPLESDEKPIRIQVVALDWKWLFIYPEYGIATINFIQFPVDVPVNFEITADAPMNSFALPSLGGQIYAMQGMTTKLHLIANRLGEFRGYSSNYSGEGFSGMKFIAKAGTKEEFAVWVNDAKASGKVLDWAEYKRLFAPSKNEPARYFSAVNGDLFQRILGQFMGHDMGTEGGKHLENNHNNH